MTTRAIINVATGHYVTGQARLWNSLEIFERDALRYLWRDAWPPGPSHQEVPYAFKPMAVRAVRDEKKADVALWMDASCLVRKSLGPVWEWIEQHGMLMFQDGWWLGQWTSDKALENLGYSRDEAMEIPLIYAIVMGFDFRSERTNAFIDEWCRLALDGETFVGAWTNENREVSSDQRCRGHRHDQSVASALAHRMEIPLFQGFHPLFSSGPDGDTIIKAGI